MGHKHLRGRNGTREGRRGAGDVERLGLGVNCSSPRPDQVNLEIIAGGPSGGRTVHSGCISGGDDILLQNDVGV